MALVNTDKDIWKDRKKKKKRERQNNMSNVKAMMSTIALHESLPPELCSALNSIHGDLQDEYLW